MLLGLILIFLIGLYNCFDISLYITKPQPDYQKISYMLAAYTYARGKLPAPMICDNKPCLPYKALGLNNKADVSNKEGILGYYTTLFTENEYNNSSMSLAITMHQARGYHSNFCLYQQANCSYIFARPKNPPKCMMGYPYHPSRDFFFDTENLDLKNMLNHPIHNLFKDLLTHFKNKSDETEDETEGIIAPYLWHQCHLIIIFVSQTMPRMLSIKSYIQEFAHFTNSFLPHTFYSFRKYQIGPEGIHYRYNTSGHTIFYTPTNIPKSNKSLIKMTNFSETLDYMDKNFTTVIIGDHPIRIEEKYSQNTQYQDFIYSDTNKEYFSISKNQLLLYMPLDTYQETKLPDYDSLISGGGMFYYEDDLISTQYYPPENRVCMLAHKWGIKISNNPFAGNKKLDIPFLRRLCYLVEET